MAKFEDLVKGIQAEVDQMASEITLGTLLAKDYESKIGHIRSLCGQILNRGRSIGWDEHAALVKERLADLAQAGLTVEELAKLPGPESEGF